MAEKTENKKAFKAGTYAVFAGIAVAVVLVVLTIFAFTTRYTAFSPEKVAQSYVDGIVQTGDGYNAYKMTLVSKNAKYGDFLRAAYMAPYVNNGDDVDQAEFVGKGTEDEMKAIDEVYNTMYDYYVELINTVGYDDYDTFFNSYFTKLAEVRHNVYGDYYMDTEYMFGAFESNVDTYAKSLTGAEQKLAADGETVLQDAIVGAYQDMYGTDYKLTSTVKECNELSADDVAAYVAEYKERIAPVTQYGEERGASLDEGAKESMVSAFAKLDNSEAITSVALATVEVALADGTVVATQQVYVVQIGNSWYVDNTNIDTSALYLVK